MFERSKAGQQNRALFYGVNYTCYVEGGDHDHDRSVDGIFWENVLGTFRPDLRIAFLPRGGKPILEALATQIVSEDIANTIVAIDSDYDDLTGDKIDDDRVIYSFGYSWENDVFDEAFLPSFIRTLARKSSLPAQARNLLADGYENFKLDARRAIMADLLSLVSGSSVLPRNAPGRIVKPHPATALPVIDRAELIKLTMAANRKTKPRVPADITDVPLSLTYFVGHCLGHGIGILVRAVLREMGIKRSISGEHLQDVAISLLQRHFHAHQHSAVAIHHRQQCVAIP